MEVQYRDADLLTLCLRSDRDEDGHSKLHGIDGESWYRLVDQAVWHGVAPLLYHRIRRSENLLIPPEAAGAAAAAASKLGVTMKTSRGHHL